MRKLRLQNNELVGRSLSLNLNLLTSNPMFICMTVYFF